MVKLENHCLSIWLDPSYGASTLALEWKGQSIMPDCRNQFRSPAAGLTKRVGLPEASFNMVPWSGRILDGVLLDKGKTYQLDRADEHAIHGEVWNQKWQICQQSVNHLSCELQRPLGSRYPWDYHVEYNVSINESKLINKLTITNVSESESLMGGGFHPYFLRKTGAVVTIKTGGQYPTGKIVGIPTGETIMTPLCEQFRQGLYMDRGQLIDDSFLLTDRTVCVEWPNEKLKMTLTLSESLSHFVVYNPAMDWFALEPVSHANNVFGSFGNTLRKPIPPHGSLDLEYVLEFSEILL